MPEQEPHDRGTQSNVSFGLDIGASHRSFRPTLTLTVPLLTFSSAGCSRSLKRRMTTEAPPRRLETNTEPATSYKSVLADEG